MGKRVEGSMERLLDEYRRALHRLYGRREEVCAVMGNYGRRLAVLDEEIDELEEAIMQMRPYLPSRAAAV